MPDKEIICHWCKKKFNVGDDIIHMVKLKYLGKGEVWYYPYDWYYHAKCIRDKMEKGE